MRAIKIYFLSTCLVASFLLFMHLVVLGGTIQKTDEKSATPPGFSRIAALARVPLQGFVSAAKSDQAKKIDAERAAAIGNMIAAIKEKITKNDSSASTLVAYPADLEHELIQASNRIAAYPADLEALNNFRDLLYQKLAYSEFVIDPNKELREKFIAGYTKNRELGQQQQEAVFKHIAASGTHNIIKGAQTAYASAKDFASTSFEKIKSYLQLLGTKPQQQLAKKHALTRDSTNPFSEQERSVKETASTHYPEELSEELINTSIEYPGGIKVTKTLLGDKFGIVRKSYPKRQREATIKDKTRPTNH